jgi:hypothetical protein
MGPGGGRQLALPRYKTGAMSVVCAMAARRVSRGEIGEIRAREGRRRSAGDARGGGSAEIGGRSAGDRLRDGVEALGDDEVLDLEARLDEGDAVDGNVHEGVVGEPLHTLLDACHARRDACERTAKTPQPWGDLRPDAEAAASFHAAQDAARRGR